MLLNVAVEQPAHRHHDRTISPRQTLARLRPHFPFLGITRLGELTGLDHVGIPVAFAVRPNSYSLALSLGKGADRDAALTSAAMEAAETAAAERLPADLRWMSADELGAAGEATVDLDAMSRCHPHRFGSGERVAWVAGRDVRTGARIEVPWALVGLDHRVAPDGYHDAFYVASDGLASGNSLEEATFHGLCELIERDAFARLQCGGNRRLARSEVRPTGQEDAHLPALLELIGRAGLRLRLFDMRSDIEVPAYLALLEARHHDHMPRGTMAARCGGCGCHPMAGRAILKAITEAVQARVALVAGARDDIQSSHYAAKRETAIEAAANDAGETLPDVPAPHPHLPTPGAGAATGTERLADLAERLDRAGVRQIIAVELDTGPADFRAVRVLAADLQVPLQGHRVQATRRGLKHLEEAAA
jgi:ribosomal protein S12 methylthiotransferase accessory factor